MSDPKVEDKKPKSLEEAIKEGISEGMALAAATAVKAVQSETAHNSPPPVVIQRGVCQLCGQQLAACKSEHRKVVVYPSNPRFARWFTGIFINGVRYLSNGHGHYVTVPKDSNVEYMITQWEESEQTAQFGSPRAGTRDSGSIGPSGSGFRPVY